MLTNLDLTDVESKQTDLFSSLIWVDHLMLASKITQMDQVHFMKDQGVTLAIDLKAQDETDFDDEAAFKSVGIEYVRYPVSDISQISFDDLNMLKEKLQSLPGNKAIYCISGNRVGAVIALLLAEIVGHPKSRAFEYGKKFGMIKEGLQEKVKARLNLAMPSL